MHSIFGKKILIVLSLFRYKYHNRFTALFPGPSGWAGARREFLDFMVQGKINRGRHTDHPAGCHSIRTNQCPPPLSPIFYRLDALPAAQPTVSKQWRQSNEDLSLFQYKYWSKYLLCARRQWEWTGVKSLNFLTLCLSETLGEVKFG